MQNEEGGNEKDVCFHPSEGGRVWPSPPCSHLGRGAGSAGEVIGDGGGRREATTPLAGLTLCSPYRPPAAVAVWNDSVASWCTLWDFCNGVVIVAPNRRGRERRGGAAAPGSNAAQPASLPEPERATARTTRRRAAEDEEAVVVTWWGRYLQAPASSNPIKRERGRRKRGKQLAKQMNPV